jgi:crossover junction endodeoxyribonuclease RuvC/BirA family biotin operon repressor/biotin-[acetyl-CoA-carboxylase] ligase
MQRRSPALVQLRARQHRCNLTPSEAALWQLIRGCRLGVWFRRQVPIGRFIVDFLAPTRRLVIEVDGGYHVTRAGADGRRTQQLARLGYRVLRLEAAVVLANPAVALAIVQAALLE